MKSLEISIPATFDCSPSSLSKPSHKEELEAVCGEENTAAPQEIQNSKGDGQTVDLLGATLHHLGEQGDAVQVDELLGEGDVPGRVGQVLQSLQLGIHAGRLDPLVKLDRGLVLEWTKVAGGRCIGVRG